MRGADGLTQSRDGRDGELEAEVRGRGSGGKNLESKIQESEVDCSDGVSCCLLTKAMWRLEMGEARIPGS